MFSKTLQADLGVDGGRVILHQPLPADGGCPLQEWNCLVVLALRTLEARGGCEIQSNPQINV